MRQIYWGFGHAMGFTCSGPPKQKKGEIYDFCYKFSKGFYSYLNRPEIYESRRTK